jgi:L-alanine-DL-glutamate epimerase-like enolase superfamily enzyme
MPLHLSKRVISARPPLASPSCGGASEEALVRLRISHVVMPLQDKWIEHFHWMEALCDERLEISCGRVAVPDRPGLGLTLSS